MDIAQANGVYQVFADDSAHPRHWLALGDCGQYFLFPRGEGEGAWYSRKPISQDQASVHLYPLKPEKALAVALLAMRVK